MKLRITLRRLIVVTVVAMVLAGAQSARAQQKSTDIPPGLKTPDRVETQIGTLEFKDGLLAAD